MGLENELKRRRIKNHSASCCDGLHKIEMIWLAETRNKGFMRAFCFVSDDDFV